MKTRKPKGRAAAGGRPRKDVDPALVERLARIDCTTTEIAAVTGCSTDTLDRRFADVIRRGRELGKRSLRRKQYDLAMKGNVTLLIWLGKQRLGQADKQQTEHHDTVTHEHRHTLDYDQLARDLDGLARGRLGADGDGQPVHPGPPQPPTSAVPGVAGA